MGERLTWPIRSSGRRSTARSMARCAVSSGTLSMSCAVKRRPWSPGRMAWLRSGLRWRWRKRLVLVHRSGCDWHHHMTDTRTLPMDDLDPAAVPAGTKQHLALTVASDIGGPLSVPAMVVRGAAPGPTLLAVAGVHGNEYEGMEAIRTVFSGLDPSAMRGTFCAIPIANPLAYAARTRATPAAVDGLNLARVFPGSANGTLTQRLAHHLLALVERHVGMDDLFLDFHSGSEDVAFATLVGFRDLSGPACQRWRKRPGVSESRCSGASQTVPARLTPRRPGEAYPPSARKPPVGPDSILLATRHLPRACATPWRSWG